jgi:hypothetical protein
MDGLFALLGLTAERRREAIFSPPIQVSICSNRPDKTVECPEYACGEVLATSISVTVWILCQLRQRSVKCSPSELNRPAT